MSDYNYNSNENSSCGITNDKYTILKEKFEEDICNNMEFIENKNKKILKSLDIIINKQNLDTNKLKELKDLKGKKKYKKNIKKI